MAVSASGATSSGQSAPVARPASAPPKNGANPQGSSGHVSVSPPPSSKGQRISGDSIMEAVDGEGVAPSLAKPEGQEALAANKAKAPAKGKAAERAAAAEAVSQNQWGDVDPEALFRDALGPEKPKSPDQELLTNEDGTPLSEREQSRFQTLANRAKAAEDRSASLENQMRQSFEQFQQGQQQLAAHLQKMEVHNARLQERLEHTLRSQREQSLTPEEQIERDLVGKASTAVEKRMMGKIQSLEGTLRQFQEQAKQEKRQSEIQTNKSRFSSEAHQAARSVVLSGFSDEEAHELMPKAREWTMAKAWAERTNMAEAAKMVRQDMLKFGLAFVRAQARLTQQKKTQSDAAPNAPPRQGADGSGEAEPTFDELRSAGFNGSNPFMDWEMAGRPALNGRR